MKTVFANALKRPQRINGEGFTLLELLVVLGVIAILITLQVPALAGAKSQTKIGMCASHVRQIALACQIYANDNRDRLPPTGGGSWAWDLPASAANGLLKSGTEMKTFYCPGTSPRFTDVENWKGPGSTLWNFGAGSFQIIGYSLTFSGSSQLSTTNQNASILPERINWAGSSVVVPVSERVLVADATLSAGSILPGYAHPENNYVNIAGGFKFAHVSPHLRGSVPAGGNLGFKDGHVAWKKFELMTPRTVAAPAFWW